MMKKARHNGFSLVELSIVLVILGLLTGGILAGQSLIRASELRSVGNDVGRFYTATQSFRDKYFALPGDMAIATQIWGTQDNTPGTCKTTPSTTILTCNGDGNGQILHTAPGSNEGFGIGNIWPMRASLRVRTMVSAARPS